MPSVKLTDIAVRAIKPPARGQATYWDEFLPGFGLRVSPGGAKTWILLRGKRRQRETIGRYPILSLAKAREEAKTRLAEYRLGHRLGPSIHFQDALQLFLSTHCDQKNRPRTAQETKRLLERHFLPTFDGRRLDEISPRNISKIIDKLLDRPQIANHAFAAIRAFFRWSVRRHYLPHAPTEGMSFPCRTRSRDRVLSERELVHVWRTADTIGFPFGPIVKLLILTGQRRGEIAGLRTEYVDRDRRFIALPAEVVKNRREHVFPYGEMAAEIIHPYLGDGYLFAARWSEVAANGFSKWKRDLDLKCPIAAWTMHDLRRTFATIQASLGTPPHVVERMLNHATGTISGVAAVYNRFAYFDEMAAALKAYENRLARLLCDPCL